MNEAVSEVLSYRSLVHAVAGATGGFTAMTVFYPLDKVRTLLQVDDGKKDKSGITVLKELLENDGLEGLYRGWFPVITSLWCSNFVYFYSYNFLKRALYGTNKPSTAMDLTAASIAGIINVLTTTPMWVVNTRLKLQTHKSSQQGETHHQQQRYDGMLDAFSKIIRMEGIASLWNGTGPSLMLVCNPTIQFVVYEALKRRCVQLYQTGQLSGPVLFVIGALAKAAATIITYPIQILQSRLRANNRSGTSPGKRANIVECFQFILRSHGWKGFYKGIETKLLQTILTAALMFMTYERIAGAVFKIMRANGK